MSARLRDVVGHERTVQRLSTAMARDRLPAAVLFTGPAGVGKWRAANAVAAVLNCQSPVRDARGSLPLDACGVCRACDRVARGVHTDVHWLEPDERASIKIDPVREALEKTAYRPFEGRRRVVLIRDADTLEPQAQNALLKGLEEPPPGTVFVLVSALPGLLLPTVRSRTMHLRFGRLPLQAVAQVLVGECEVPQREADAAAALGDGSAGQALAFRQKDLPVLREAALLLLRSVAADRGGAASRLQAAAVLLNPGNRKERSRDELVTSLRLTASLLRDLELLNGGGDPGGLVNGAMASELQQLQSAYSGARARTAFVAVDQGLQALERNAGSKVVAEWVSLQM